MPGNPRSDGILPFDRSFFESDETISRIGSGSLGGKAQGLALVRQLLASRFSEGGPGGISATLISTPSAFAVGNNFCRTWLARA